MWWGLFRLLMGAAVLGCIAASATFAFEFAWTRGATEAHRWTFALAGVALDLVKSGLPIFGAQAWHERNPARALACWLVFMVLTGLSLWCAYGTTAIQLASRIATQAVVSTSDEDNRAKLKRLRAQRDALSVTETSAEAVKAAEGTVEAAKKSADEERARVRCGKECKDREKEERDARTALVTLQSNRALTVKAAELDRKIEDAETVVRASNTVDTKKEPDPQSASMAKAIGADQDIIAAISHVFFAISIELGSGVGFWLVFGHDRREDNAALTALEIDRAGAEDLVVIEQTPADIVGRFFLQAVRPARGRRTQSLTIWSAYRRWCAERPERGAAVTHAMFGKLARWPKERAGGVVWYLDCELAPHYAVPALPASKTLPRPAMAADISNDGTLSR